ncbi:hypothetical protein WR25_14192 [Diploscapter pachys]|uniref:Uncharacterized protein n=1 Tax=Diploscapter pachys TaxID=2018661 RepID=A0A2A2LZ94_9BILA|nr:hypothetical protein WR25_14192 [Diploscapter pachys]
MIRYLFVVLQVLAAGAIAMSLGPSQGDSLAQPGIRTYAAYPPQISRMQFLSDDGYAVHTAELKPKRNYDFVRFGRSAPTKKASYDYIRFGKRSSNPLAAFRNVKIQNRRK